MNGSEHRVIGGLAGLALVAFAASRQNRAPRVGELVSGVLCGVAGASLPDTIEPADHPHHRNTAHSHLMLATTATIAVTGASLLEGVPVHADPVAQFLRDLMRSVPMTLAVGYGSHLASDATTPRGLPLV